MLENQLATGLQLRIAGFVAMDDSRRSFPALNGLIRADLAGF
jgi:hypothetical protein